MDELQVQVQAETMTTKELCEFFGKSTPTILKHLKAIGVTPKNGIVTELDKDQIEKLSRLLYSQVPKGIQNSIDELFPNISSTPLSLNSTAIKPLRVSEKLDRVCEALVSLTAAIQPLLQKPFQIEDKTEKKEKPSVAAILDDEPPMPPKLSHRSSINIIMQEYAVSKKIDFDAAYNLLYKRFNYSYRMNLALDARREKEREIGRLPYSYEYCTLDYAERHNLIEDLYSIAYHVFLIK